MMDDFDHIIKQLLANLPQHSPKSEVWNKINSSLDEDVALTRLRRMLKNNQHKPKVDLWPAIESSLNKPVFRKAFYQSAWVKFIVPSLIVLTTLIFIKPYISPDTKIVYNSPLQRNANAAEIISENPVVLTSNSPVIVSPSNSGFSADKNSNQNLNNNTNLFGNQNEQSYSNQLPEDINDVQNTVNDLNIGNTDIAVELEKTADENFNKNLYLLNPLSLFSLGMVSNTDDKMNSGLLSNHFPESSLNKGLGRGNFSLELSFGPQISFMDLKSNLDESGINVEMRKQAEMPSYSWSAGVEGKIDFRHCFFQTGLNYSKISTVSEYRYKYIDIDTVGWYLTDTAYVHSFIDSLGICHDTLFISYSWDPVTGLVSYDQKKKASYQINYVQIPLIAGYSMSRGKFQYSVSGGISLGIPLSISGSMIGTDNYTISGVAEQSLPLRKIVYSGLLRAGVNYFISPRYSIFAQPSVNYTLNPVFGKNYPVNQKYLTYGLRMGITYRF
jgi:hypothetical protein